MRKNFVKTLALVGMVGMMSSTGLVAHAAEAPAAQTQTVKQNLNATVIAKVFDAKYYAQKNPDVVAVVGNDAATLLKHYMNSGIYEGRDASATFNADAYASANTDVATLAAGNYETLFEHYVNAGINEKRIATTADATKAGITVTSVANPTVVLATPVAKAAASNTGSSSSGSSSSGSSNGGSSESYDDGSGSYTEMIGNGTIERWDSSGNVTVIQTQTVEEINAASMEALGFDNSRDF